MRLSRGRQLALGAAAQPADGGAPPIQRPNVQQPLDEPPPPERPAAPEGPAPVAEPTPVAPAPTPEPGPAPVPIDEPLELPQPFAPPPDAAPAAPAGPRPISPMFRRPGVWVAIGSATLAASTLLRFITPVVAACRNPSDVCDVNVGALLAISLANLPLDAVAMTAWGFAGRSYGLRDARAGSPHVRRVSFLGGGVPLVIAGGAMTFASYFAPIGNFELDMFGYPMLALRHGGIVLGAAGAFLIGYGVALPRERGFAARDFSVEPVLSRESFGIALAFRR